MEDISEEKGNPAKTAEVIEAAKKIEAEDESINEVEEIDLSSHSASDILLKENKFKVESLLAKGGMAMVFKAKDKNCRRTVALKLINDGDIDNPEVVHRFIEEAQIAAQLDHPNILPIYELNIDKKGNPFYAMKLVKGSTLEEIIIRLKQNDEKTVKEYPLSKLLQIFVKICEAVGFASSKNVVHRDLKPENIMIGEYGEVFIMDWGIAKVCNEDNGSHGKVNSIDEMNNIVDSVRKDDSFNTSTTMQGQILGTPGFMAPEQVLSTRGKITTQTDIYALGGILFNILALERPHSELDIKSLFMSKLQGKIPTPESRAAKNQINLVHIPTKKIPAALSSICMKAMSNNPEDRYSSAGDLLEDIDLYVNGYATHAEGASQLRMLKLLLSRHRRLSFELAILIGMVILFITQNYYKLATFKTNIETTQGTIDQIQLQKRNKEFDVKEIRKHATAVLPEFEQSVADLIEKKEHARALMAASKFLRLSESPQLYKYKIELLLHFSREFQAQRTLSKALDKFPGSAELATLQKTLRNK